MAAGKQESVKVIWVGDTRDMRESILRRQTSMDEAVLAGLLAVGLIGWIEGVRWGVKHTLHFQLGSTMQSMLHGLKRRDTERRSL